VSSTHPSAHVATSAAPARGAGRFVAVRFALRELKGARNGLVTLLACLALGVGAIAGSASVNLALKESLAADAQSLLGGDLQVRITHREATETERATLAGLGRVSHQIEMRSMAHTVRDAADSSGRSRSLIELKAVDAAYPLYGEVGLAGAASLADALAYRDGRHGAAIEPALGERLGLDLGDTVRIGDARFTIRARITSEPDRVATFASFGPRVMVSKDGMTATGLTDTGSLVRYVYNVELTSGLDYPAAKAALARAHPDAGWRVRGLDEAVQGFADVLDNITLFFNLAGLTTLMVGGIGVANAVRAYLERRVRTIAALKCLGASRALVTRIYALQVGVLALVGIAAGLVLGSAVPPVVEAAFGAALPGEMTGGPRAAALAHAAAFGVLTTALFALWPLALAREVSPALLVRGTMTLPAVRPSRRDAAALALALTALVAYTIGSAATPRIAAGFVAGAVGSVVILRLAAFAIARAARAGARPGARLTRGRPALRLALSNLHRPGALTVNVVLSLGLGLTVLVAIAMIEANLRTQIVDRLPENAPSYFFLDIQRDQVEAFEREVNAVARDVPGTRVELAPMIRGRIAAVDGTPVDEAEIEPDVAWAFRGDRGLSYSDRPVANSKVVAGQWWSEGYDDELLVSMDADIARGSGLDVGDTITINVLGRELTATIANLREIEWQTARMNFTFVYNEAALAAAPVNFIATLHAPDAAARRVEARIIEALPNVTAISVAEAIERVNGLLSTGASVIRAIAGIALVAGLFVLTSAIAAGHLRRVYETVILKVLGGTRREVFVAFAIEYALLGAATGVFAVLAGGLGAYAVIRYVMGGSWQFEPAVALAIVAGGVALTFIAGFGGVYRALGARAAPFLRNE